MFITIEYNTYCWLNTFAFLAVAFCERYCILLYFKTVIRVVIHFTSFTNLPMKYISWKKDITTVTKVAQGYSILEARVLICINSRTGFEAARHCRVREKPSVDRSHRHPRSGHTDFDHQLFIYQLWCLIARVSWTKGDGDDWQAEDASSHTYVGEENKLALIHGVQFSINSLRKPNRLNTSLPTQCLIYRPMSCLSFAI